MKVLIIGGVAGGATAAARLRRLDEGAQIIMFEKGEHVSFANCGLPYYIGNVIEAEENLILKTPKDINSRYNIDVRINSEVISVDTKKKSVTVKNVIDGNTYVEYFDKLIISPGSKPIKPRMNGIDNENVFTLKNISDATRIKSYITENNVKDAVVIGGGFIGLEVAENLYEAGLNVSIVEAMSHIITTIDDDMAAEVHNHIRGKQINLYLNSKVIEIEKQGIILENGDFIKADIIMLSVGVIPDTEFLKDSGIILGNRGEIIVDEYLRTSVEDIYAIGDAIQTNNIVSNEPCRVALASPANKQGRIVSDNIVGRNSRYAGALGTAILKIFDLNVGTTGLSEAMLKINRLDYKKAIVCTASHASYYKGASMITIKLVFEPETGRIFGGQVVGSEGVDKRTDIIATAIHQKMTVFDLQELELAYAPPFSSAKDPINMIGYVAGNIVEGFCDPIYVEELEDLTQDDFLLDVRTPAEFSEGTIGDAVNYPVDGLRDELHNIPKDKNIIIICRTAMRAHVAQRILAQNGYRSKNLIGGYRLYSMKP